MLPRKLERALANQHFLPLEYSIRLFYEQDYTSGTRTCVVAVSDDAHEAARIRVYEACLLMRSKPWFPSTQVTTAIHVFQTKGLEDYCAVFPLPKIYPYPM